MKIRLIQPKMIKRPMDTSLKVRMAPSLALLTIAKLLHNEHEVIIENENINKIDYDIPADIIGITITVDVMPRAIEISEKFREKGVIVVAGGIHITSDPKSAEGYFDAICIGAAEYTWPDIINDIQHQCLKKIYYANFRLNGEHLVSPAYEDIDKSKYLYTNIVSTSRGCPYKCDFCYNSCRAFKDMFINRPVEDVVADIKALNTKHIMFVDDNFIGNPEWTIRLLEEITPMKIKWNAAVSANLANMPHLIDVMKMSGCQSLFIGFESVNEMSLLDINKKHNDITQYDRLVNEIHSRGIMINASFVFGLDADEPSIFKSTLEWIIKNKIETVTSHILTPYPGTNLYDRLLSQNRIIDFDLSKYNTANVVYKPQKMTGKELYDGYLWIYREIYSIKNILKRIPKAKQQRAVFFAFNLLYRKFGRFTELLCKLNSFNKIGKLAEWIVYGVK